MRGDFHGRVARGKQPGGMRRSCWCLSAWKTRHWGQRERRPEAMKLSCT